MGRMKDVFIGRMERAARRGGYSVADGRGMFCADCMRIVDAVIGGHGGPYCDACYSDDVHHAPRRVRMLARDLQAAEHALIRRGR
jgi:hypothetical protein